MLQTKRLMTIVLIAALWLTTSEGMAQNPTPTLAPAQVNSIEKPRLLEEAKKLQDEADTLFRENQADKNAGELFAQAREKYHAAGDIKQEIVCLIEMSNISENSFEFQQSLQYLNETLPLAHAVKDVEREVEITRRIGATYINLGEEQKALENLENALQLFRSVKPAPERKYQNGRDITPFYLLQDRQLEGQILNNIGNVYLKLGEWQKALGYFEQALPILNANLEMATAAAVMNNIGRASQELGKPYSALQNYNMALKYSRAAKDKSGEAYLLNNIAAVYDDNLGDKQKALEYYNQALALGRLSNNKRAEAVTLNNLMLLHDSLNNRRIAIVYGKQAVNLYQELRSKLKFLDPTIQQSYLTSVEDTYRTLAKILVEEGRLPEAEQVLQMLKEEEYFGFVRRDDKVAKDLLTRAKLSPSEQAMLERYDKIADEIFQLSEEYNKLEEEKGKLAVDQRAPIVARQKEINAKLADARGVFEKFLEELKKRLGERDERVAEVEDGLQAEVNRWNEPRTVVISTILDKNSLSIVLTTREISRAYIVDQIGNEKFSEEKLNALINEFRQATKDPSIDPRPAGQKLYDILVKPLEKDLQAVKAKTLVWSLDGNLRYVPLAALYDEQQGYLTERYASVLITLASRGGLEYQPTNKNDWQILGLGVSKAVGGFSALTNVPAELRAIVHDETQGDETGLINGRRLLDEKFDREALDTYLGGYKIVHAATHFDFIPGTKDQALKSYLLLGDGQKLTLAEIKNAGTMFAGVELLVLSACETEAGGKDADGREVEGLGALAQKAGARAVIATLWSIADDSTLELMTNFYKLQRQNGLNKVEALRQAQVEMITGKIKSATSEKKRLPSSVAKLRDNSILPFKYDPQKPYAHPFFWSPFILIGNWR